MMWALRLLPATLSPVAFFVIVMKLYPYYHHNVLELIFFSQCCLLWDLRQILGNTPEHVENLLTA